MVEKQSEMWLNPHAVRIHTTKRIRHESTATISPDTLSIIKVNYQVPFPLSQLFTSTSLDLRADVFGFLMQVVFAKNLLATTKEYEPHKSEKLDEDMLILLQARHRLVWIVK
jgi:gamma-tubulin complex component 5